MSYRHVVLLIVMYILFNLGVGLGAYSPWLHWHEYPVLILALPAQILGYGLYGFFLTARTSAFAFAALGLLLVFLRVWPTVTGKVVLLASAASWLVGIVAGTFMGPGPMV